MIGVIKFQALPGESGNHHETFFGEPRPELESTAQWRGVDPSPPSTPAPSSISLIATSSCPKKYFLNKHPHVSEQSFI